MSSKTASGSFLKKRTKKLLLGWHSGWVSSHANEQKFLLLFSKRSAFFSCVALLTLFAAPASAADQSASIVALNAGLAAAEKMSTQPFPARYAALAPKVDAAFDLPQILKTIVGLKWQAVSAPDQARLLTVFRAFTIANYAANFNSDSGDAFRVLPATREVGADRVVETEIVPKIGDPVRIDYVMREGAGGWRAIDVLQQGTISQAAVQRSDFRTLLAGGAPALVASLTQKVDTMSGGTIKP